MPDFKPPRGTVLKVDKGQSGWSQVEIDNGPFRTITLHTVAESLGDLLESDTRAIMEHLMTRKKGHFRRK